MKRLLRSEKAFTLIEMLVVLMIISMLLLIVIPNMTKNNEVAAKKGCEATIKLLQTQVHAYEIETGAKPESLGELSKGKYVKSIECPGETELEYNSESGEITEKETAVTE